MANQNGRNSSMSDDDDDRERMYTRDERYGRSWDDRWDRDRSMSNQRSIDRGGQGQSGYGAGRYEGDRGFSQRNQSSVSDDTNRTNLDERWTRGRYDNNGNYLAQGGQQMGRGYSDDRNRDDYRSGYEGQGQGGYGSYGNQGSSQREQYGTHGYGSSQGMGMSGGYSPQHSQHPQGMQNYGQQGSNENTHQYGNTGQWGNYGTPSWNTGSPNMNMGQPGVGGSYNQGNQGGSHGYIGADRPISHHYGSQQGHGQSNFSHETYQHLGQHNYGHLGPQQGAHMSGGGQMAYGAQQHGAWGQGMGQQQPQYEEHESLGQRIKGWFQGHRGKGPSGYTRSDDRIREMVCEALSDDDRVDASNIEVTVKNGEVVLSGTVEDRMQKRMAEDCIENLSGVKDVQNQLRVSSMSTMSTQSSGTQRSTTMSQNVDLSTQGSGTSVGQNGADKRHKA